jgi:hypothetical protein
MASIEQHIVKTAGSYYSFVEDHHDIATELAILKARVEPIDWAHEQDVLERYHDILNGPSRTRIEDWITSWRKVLTKAKNFDLPDVTGLRPTRQFLHAVSSISSSFSDCRNLRIEDLARRYSSDWQKKVPDGFKISELPSRTT